MIAALDVQELNAKKISSFVWILNQGGGAYGQTARVLNFFSKLLRYKNVMQKYSAGVFFYRFMLVLVLKKQINNSRALKL